MERKGTVLRLLSWESPWGKREKTREIDRDRVDSGSTGRSPATKERTEIQEKEKDF